MSKEWVKMGAMMQGAKPILNWKLVWLLIKYLLGFSKFEPQMIEVNMKVEFWANKEREVEVFINGVQAEEVK